MAIPSNAAEAIYEAESILTKIQNMGPEASIYNSPEMEQARLELLVLVGLVLTGLLPPQSQSEYDRAGELYKWAELLKETGKVA
ncbi:hypothetical protein [Pseudomonas sp. sia0905]|uniref:hypothetical protein n=1 Tax=Pseudomonas sp. sia0905 TaxID=2854783 RepID=UPI001C437653|nr:hypothetical protein [Pseudomonas sp. sia0905]MBV7561535.1 hypothetical protein [Pseudomonas sp. sia0905]